MVECKADAGEDQLDALCRMEFHDTPVEEAFNRITRLAKTVLEMPVVVVSLLDDSRQWLTSMQYPDAAATSRNATFSDLTTQNTDRLVVENALLDKRLADNPLVTGKPGIRFYAGIPLSTRTDQSLGTLCAIDFKPRTITDQQLGILEDLAQLVVNELELRLIATTDSLTGAMTRRAVFEAAGRDMARARRKDLELSCAILDIDHFKPVNDTFGHAAGDLVLQQIVNVCRRNLRASDHIGRIGGEEFAILLQDTDEATAFDVVERMRSEIEKLPIVFDGKKVPVTASFGVAGLTPATGSFDALLREADTALYVAKANGRNRTVGSQEVEQAVNAA